uniref:Uncharacterized protein n=1 Tax=Ditylenchus dipsaci TaxID=166011 RepID=A0A915CT94_9BILA
MQRMYTDLSPTASLLTNSENTSISVQTSKLQEAFDFERGQRGVCIQTTGNFAAHVKNSVPRFLGSQSVERVSRKLKKEGDVAIFHPLPEFSYQADLPSVCPLIWLIVMETESSLYGRLKVSSHC